MNPNLETRTLPEFWSFLFEQLKKLNWSGSNVYIVGGAVRDALMSGKTSHDIDMVVEAEGGAERLAKALSAHWAETSTQPHPLGAGYPIWQLICRAPQGEFEIQIADTQKEMFMDAGSRQRVTSYGNLNEDCARRDFSYNMLYFDLLNQKVVDPCGVGLRDLEANVLRSHPQVSPDQMFSDDPLRMLRLLRFHSRFGSEIDTSLIASLKKNFSRVEILSQERVRDEWIKASKQGGLSKFFEILSQNQLLPHICPELLPMLDCAQDSKFHAEGDVWTHTLLVMKNAEQSPLQQMVALLHDIAKPATQSFEGDRIKFLGHEKLGAEMSKTFLEKWKFPKALRQNICRLVELHLRGCDVEEWGSLKPARKLIRDCDGLEDELLKFLLADSMSSLRQDGSVEIEYIEVLREKLNEAKEQMSAQPKVFVTGKDIMAHFPDAKAEEIGRLKSRANEIAESHLDRGLDFEKSKVLSELALEFTS